MSKGLKALENIKREAGTPYFSTLYDIDMWKEDFATVEKELKEYQKIKEIAKRYNWHTITSEIYYVKTDKKYRDLFDSAIVDIQKDYRKARAFEIITSKKTNIAMLFWYFKYTPNYEKYVEAFNALSSDCNEEMLTKDEYEFLKRHYYD